MAIFHVPSHQFSARAVCPVGKVATSSIPVFPICTRPKDKNSLQKKDSEGMGHLPSYLYRDKSIQVIRVDSEISPPTVDTNKSHRAIVEKLTVLPYQTQVRDNNNNGKLGVFTDSREKHIVGSYRVNKKEMTKLKQEWGSGQSALICGTDGRLKEGIRTSGYIIYRMSDKAELITG